MYRNIFSTSFVLFCFQVFSAQIPLEKALETKVLSIQILVDEMSPHYDAPFVFKLKNNTNQKQEVFIPTGLTLIAQDENDQNFVITQEYLVVLEPFKSISKPVKAMCLERNDAAPNEYSIYKVGFQASENICKLSKFINDNKKFNPNAQLLMWEIADRLFDVKPENFFQINTDNEIEIVSLNNEGKREIVNRKEEPKVLERELKIYGNFSMNLSGTRNIHIAMFNMDNVLVKELYNNPQTPKGENKIEYAINSLEFPDEKYQIKLVMNGRIMMQREVIMDI